MKEIDMSMMSFKEREQMIFAVDNMKQQDHPNLVSSIQTFMNDQICLSHFNPTKYVETDV